MSRAFTPRMVSMLAERAERYADAAIDAIINHGRADFVTDLAVPVPMRIIADMLGVADGDLERFWQWTNAVISGTDPSGETSRMQEAIALIGDLRDYVDGKIEDRRANPQDDILTKIVQAADEGQLADAPDDGEGGNRFNTDKIKDTAFFLLMAGNETTRNGISQGMLALLQHSEQRARLAADLSLLATAADEVLRWTTPVCAMRRVAMRDTELRGQKIREGESVVMVYASANRDEAVFDEPHKFRIDRTPNEHLSLGYGPHYSLGTNLAKMEIRAAFSRVLARLPDLRLAEEPMFMPSALIDGILEMPVEW